MQLPRHDENAMTRRRLRALQPVTGAEHGTGCNIATVVRMYQFCLAVAPKSVRRRCRTDDPNDQWKILREGIIRLIDKYCPLKELHVSVDRPAYLSDELLELMHKRDRTFTLARKNGKDENWTNARSLRSQVQSGLIRDKKDFIADRITKAEGDGAAFWRTMRKYFLKESDVDVSQILNPETAEVLVGKDAANFVNDYFCNVSQELSKKFKEPVSQRVEGSGPFTSMLPVTLGKVREQVSKIDTTKSSGLVCIPASLLKLALLEILQPYTDLLNICISCAIFPAEWKLAIMVPIPKKGDIRLPNNLRPISLLPVTGKIFE